MLTTDSTSHTTAIIAADGENHAMTITIKEPDLTLAGDTPNGTMTVTIQRHGDSITGSWARGIDGGTISGKRAP